jgi:hypothetical protein
VTPKDYSQPFEITRAVGNNALSFDRRGPAPSLWVPSVVTGTFDDVKAGSRVVFEEFDENGVLRSCPGLAHLVKTTWHGIPTVVMDNHNHAFYFWSEARTQGIIGPRATLIHVDQHRDTRVPERMYDGDTLDEAFAYTNFHLNVGNYVVPAERAGLIGLTQMVTGEDALCDRRFLAHENKILNIDLDFFAPEMSYIDFALAAEFIAAHLKSSSFVSIATSPFFIEQGRAVDVLRQLISATDRFLLNMGP